MKLKERIHRFLHDEKLKRKLYVIIFESDTPAGKLFDVILIACILVSVLLVIIESLKGLPTYLDRKSTRLNSSHPLSSRMPSSA